MQSDPEPAELTLPVSRPDVDRDSLPKLGAAAQEYGTLEKAPDLDTLLP